MDAVFERLVATANLVEMPIGERYCFTTIGFCSMWINAFGSEVSVRI